MVICIFGESCTGKTTLANAIHQRSGATIYTGKDYLRLAKNAGEAREKFKALLASAAETDDVTIYVVTEQDMLSLLPPNCTRVLVTEELPVIKERFARRTGGTLPAGVAAMLEKKHGCFDRESHDFAVHSGAANIDMILGRLAE